MREETLLCHEPWPDVRLDQLQTLARLERRAEILRAELAALQELLSCIMRQPDPDAAWSDLCGSETILIADDQVSVRAITQGMLESFGYRVLVTDAHTRLESCAADLVLLDVPAWDDRARVRLRQIRARGVPIVVSTPLPEGPARLELRQAGADAFIAKPFHPLELTRCIRRVLDVTSPASTE
jgi:twitching motility two-component system response regulator PilH